MNSINITGRADCDATIAYVGQSNRPLARFILTRTRQIGPDRTRIIELPVLIWGSKAEAAAPRILRGSTVAVSGEIDHDFFTMHKDQQARARTLIIADTIEVLAAPSPS